MNKRKAYKLFLEDTIVELRDGLRKVVEHRARISSDLWTAKKTIERQQEELDEYEREEADRWMSMPGALQRTVLADEIDEDPEEEQGAFGVHVGMRRKAKTAEDRLAVVRKELVDAETHGRLLRERLDRELEEHERTKAMVFSAHSEMKGLREELKHLRAESASLVPASEHKPKFAKLGKHGEVGYCETEIGARMGADGYWDGPFRIRLERVDAAEKPDEQREPPSCYTNGFRAPEVARALWEEDGSPDADDHAAHVQGDCPGATDPETDEDDEHNAASQTCKTCVRLWTCEKPEHHEDGTCDEHETAADQDDPSWRGETCGTCDSFRTGIKGEPFSEWCVCVGGHASPDDSACKAWTEKDATDQDEPRWKREHCGTCTFYQNIPNHPDRPYFYTAHCHKHHCTKTAFENAEACEHWAENTGADDGEA